MSNNVAETLTSRLRLAVVSGDAEEMMAAEACLRLAFAELQINAASKDELETLLASVARTAALVRSASDFYSGAASILQVQLAGYGSSTHVAPQTGSRFAAEG